MSRNDLRAVVALLTEDATWSMPPMPGFFAGLEAVTAFLVKWPLTERWRHLPTMANGQRAVGCYRFAPERERHEFAVLDVLTVREERIATVVGFMTPSLHERFGLPAHLG